MGVHLGASHISPTQKPEIHQYRIESVIQGKDFSTIYGQTFIVEKEYPADYQHGTISLCADREMEILARWCVTPRIANPGSQNIVFLDTETSGLAGGTGTYAFLVGIGYRTETGFHIIQFFMREPSHEPALLAALDQWLARFDVIVTFNGKSFDVPLLNTRFMMNGISTPFDRFEHVDVLHIARKLWRDRLPSRALGDLEKEIVRFSRTADDIPGWLIPQIYFDYLHSGDDRPLSGIFYHNAIDILSLTALFEQIGEMLKDPLHKANRYGLDMAAIARLYEEMGMLEEAANLYEQSLHLGDLPEPFFLKTIERYALLRRRQQDWDKAIQLWQKAAECGHVTACIELSKYYEHRERNFTQALEWARKAIDALDYSEQNMFSVRAVEHDIQRRIGRLYQKTYRAYNKPST